MTEEKRIKRNKSDLSRKQKNARAVVEFRWRNKMKLIQYKGGKCEICGYDKPIAGVYHFHHKNPEEKEFTVARYMSRSFENLVKEVDKCMLICGNCHAEEHDKEFSEIREQTIKSWEEWDIEEQAKREKKKKVYKPCIQCKEDFHSNNKGQKYCSVKCRVVGQQKVEKPSKAELKKLIEENSWLALGRKFGVSDNAVRKWARKYKLI